MPKKKMQSIIVVDGLNEGPEEVVEKLTGCFASASLGGGLPELGEVLNVVRIRVR